jgi:hypothetical protein
VSCSWFSGASRPPSWKREGTNARTKGALTVLVLCQPRLAPASWQSGLFLFTCAALKGYTVACRLQYPIERFHGSRETPK